MPPGTHIRAPRCLIFAAIAITPTRALADDFTPGDVLVSIGNTVVEYTPDGVMIQSIPILDPGNGEAAPRLRVASAGDGRRRDDAS
jgi:hypothetical protein